MPGNLRAIADIQAEIDAAGERGIVAQTFLDTLQSVVKVAGVMSLDEPTVATPIVGGWNRVDMWASSRDTQGVRDGLTDPTDPGGWYKINRAASGDYTTTARVRFTTDTAGVYELRIAKKLADGTAAGASHKDIIDIPADTTVSLHISQALFKGVDGNERLQVEYRGPNGAIVTALSGEFGIQR